jgi:hypothetical protein
VIVVRHVIILPGVVDNVVYEGNPALLQFIGKLKLIEDLELIHGFHLPLFSRGQQSVGVFGGILHFAAQRCGMAVTMNRKENGPSKDSGADTLNNC